MWCESDDEWFFRGHLIFTLVATVVSILVVGILGYALFSYWATGTNLPLYEGYYFIQYVLIFSIAIGFRYIPNSTRWIIGMASGEPFRGLLHDKLSRCIIWFILIIIQPILLLIIYHVLLNQRFDLLVGSIMGVELENPLTPPTIVVSVLLGSTIGTALLVVNIIKTEIIAGHDHSGN